MGWLWQANLNWCGGYPGDATAKSNSVAVGMIISMDTFQDYEVFEL
jgi:hypothetical protein